VNLFVPVCWSVRKKKNRECLYQRNAFKAQQRKSGWKHRSWRSGKAPESSLNPEPSLLSSRQTFKTFHLDYLIHRSVSENYVIIVFFRKLERAYLVLAFRGKVAFSGSIRAACKQGMPMQWSELPERKTIRRGASTSNFPDLFSCFDLYFMTGEL